MIRLSNECDLELDFNLKVHWIEPPKNHAEKMLRDQTQHRFRMFIKTFEEKIEQQLKVQYESSG